MPKQTVTVAFYDKDPDDGSRFIHSFMNLGDDLGLSDDELIAIARRYSTDQTADAAVLKFDVPR